MEVKVTGMCKVKFLMQVSSFTNTYQHIMFDKNILNDLMKLSLTPFLKKREVKGKVWAKMLLQLKSLHQYEFTISI